MGPRKRLRLTEVNSLLMCALCGGYLIDATAIVECLHSFCRSCLIKYLDGNSFCPICDVQIHKAKPFRNIKPDTAMQCIVYKLVPGLYHAEMARRREFYSKHPDRVEGTTPEDRGMGLERLIYAPDDKISLSLSYYDLLRDSDENDNATSSCHNLGFVEYGGPKRRYLLCPSLVTVGHIKKLLRFKYSLTPAQKLDVFYKHEHLGDDLTLMDVAYIYTWKGNGPMEIQYRFHDIVRQPAREDAIIELPPAAEVSNVEYYQDESKSLGLETDKPEEKEITSSQTPGAAVENGSAAKLSVDRLQPPSESNVATQVDSSNESNVATQVDSSNESKVATQGDSSNKSNVATQGDSSNESNVATQGDSSSESNVAIHADSSSEPDVATHGEEYDAHIQRDSTNERDVVIEGGLSIESTVVTERSSSNESTVSPQGDSSNESAVTTQADSSNESAVTIQADSSNESTVAIKADSSNESTVAIKADSSNEPTVSIKADSSNEPTVSIKADSSNESTVSIKADSSNESTIATHGDSTDGPKIDTHGDSTDGPKIDTQGDSSNDLVVTTRDGPDVAIKGELSNEPDVTTQGYPSNGSDVVTQGDSFNKPEVEPSVKSCKPVEAETADTPKELLFTKERMMPNRDSSDNPLTKLASSKSEVAESAPNPANAVSSDSVENRVTRGKNALLVDSVKDASKLPAVESAKSVPVIEKEKTSRISIGLLASLALERRSNSAVSISHSRKRMMNDANKMVPEKKSRLVIKPLPNPSNAAPSVKLSNNVLNLSQGQDTRQTETSQANKLGNAILKDRISYLPGKLTITPISPQKTVGVDKTKSEEHQPFGEIQVKPYSFPPILENIERPKRPASHLPILQTPPSKLICDQLNSKTSDIPRLIEINSTSASKSNAKKNRVISKQLTKRGNVQKHDGSGALDLSSTTRQNHHSADILAIAQNLARRQQLLAQTPIPPLSPLSPFPMPNFVPVRSPPPPLRIPVPSGGSSPFRLQHPPQQRPSSVSSSSPSPPAENGTNNSRSPLVGTSSHEMFQNPAHPGLMFRSGFELQNPWHGKWYNAGRHIMHRCLENFRRSEGISSVPYFANPSSASTSGNKKKVRK